MFAKLLLLFTLVPILELSLLIWLGQIIGLWTTITIVIITGLLGASLAKWQGFIIIKQVKNDLNLGKIPGDSLIDGLLILIAGALLLTPGITTDLLGIALLLPPTRSPFRNLIKKRFNRWMKKHTFSVNVAGAEKNDIIDIS